MQNKNFAQEYQLDVITDADRYQMMIRKTDFETFVKMMKDLKVRACIYALDCDNENESEKVVYDTLH